MVRQHGHSPSFPSIVIAKILFWGKNKVQGYILVVGAAMVKLLCRRIPGRSRRTSELNFTLTQRMKCIAVDCADNNRTLENLWGDFRREHVTTGLANINVPAMSRKMQSVNVLQQQPLLSTTTPFSTRMLYSISIMRLVSLASFAGRCVCCRYATCSAPVCA